MKKLFTLLFVAAVYVCAFADCTVYYAGSYTAPKAYAWSSSSKNAAWPGQAMTATDYTFNGKTIYRITLTQNFPNIIFNSNGSQTADLYTQCGQLYDGENDRWVAYVGTGDLTDTSVTKDPENVVGVPSEYEGVMLQAFYWNSYTLNKYSNTRWATLDSLYVDAIGEDFSLVWFPPANYGGGVGYYVKSYSKLTSDWGSKSRLLKLIDALHEREVKVIADIVVNHRQSSSGFATFYNEDFQGFGTYQLNSTHICANDEAFTDSKSEVYKSSAHGAVDTGTGDGGCRDLDHTSEYVQSYVKAYLDWMRDSIGFDGWRYDMVKGYHGRYVSHYNISSQPFFSVGEYWDGNASNLNNYLSAASYNTTVFDFSLKYKIKSAITRTSLYGASLKNAGMRSLGLQKYAVTFIDNHDTFERSDNQADEFLGYNTVLTHHKKPIMQANAYLLMMPGVPCVFWPHWYTFQEDIHALIALRKAAGIHSESVVLDEVGTTQNYEATIVGHHGSVVLRMGTKRNMEQPVGYFLAIQGPDFEVYASNGIDYAPTIITAVESTEAEIESRVRKEVRNGKVVIIRDGVCYDLTGRVVE